MNLISTVGAHLLTVAIPRELISKLRLLTQRTIASPKPVAAVVRKIKNMG